MKERDATAEWIECVKRREVGAFFVLLTGRAKEREKTASPSLPLSALRRQEGPFNFLTLLSYQAENV